MLRQNDMSGVVAHSGRDIDVVGGTTIMDCSICGFVHVMPLPSEHDLQKFYQKDFYETEKPDYLKYAEEDREWWRATYNRYYELLEQHTSGRTLLDIGSGPGYFLDAGAARGWNVIGFEPSTSAAAYAKERGSTVVNDVFAADKAATHGPFDVVMLSLVLEHVPGPARVVAEAAQVLKPGGLLCIIVPNDYNPLQKVLVERHGFAPWWVVPGHHLNYFSIGSLKTLVSAQQLSPVHLETSYPMELFLLSGRNYVGNPDVGRVCHKERKALEMALFTGDKALLQNMYSAWAKQGIGREVVLIARKET